MSCPDNDFYLTSIGSLHTDHFSKKKNNKQITRVEFHIKLDTLYQNYLPFLCQIGFKRNDKNTVSYGNDKREVSLHTDQKGTIYTCRISNSADNSQEIQINLALSVCSLTNQKFVHLFSCVITVQLVNIFFILFYYQNLADGHSGEMLYKNY